jgi:hypothetical protein
MARAFIRRAGSKEQTMTRRLLRSAVQALAPAAAVAIALATALLLAACGGCGDQLLSLHALPAAVSIPVAAAASAPMRAVQLAGCVVDDYFQPRGDTPVRALGADGRLLANAQSDARGAFKLQLPAGQTVTLAVDRPEGDFIQVTSGRSSRALTTCLVDPSA